MTKMYLIRHAEAEGNLYRIYQGQRDMLVTEEGKAQIQALAERFRDISVDVVYSSDLYRAAATAAGICRVKGLPLQREPALREICVGEWEGMPVGTVARERVAEAAAFRNGQNARGNSGAETRQEVTERMMAALRRIAAAHDGQTVVVVSHGAAIRYALSEILKDAPEMEGAAAISGNTGVTEMDVEDGTFRVHFLHDTSHLDCWMERLLGRVPPKRNNGLEAGLWYQIPQGAEQEMWLRTALGLDAESACPTYEEGSLLLGMRGDEPVGLLGIKTEMEAEQKVGWIDLLWVRPECRRNTCGVQLLGQAVCRYRDMGREFLRTAVAKDDAETLEFLEHQGFRPAAVQGDDKLILEKDIAIRLLDI